MNTGRAAAMAQRAARPAVGAAAAVMVVAAFLFTRFDLYGKLTRDSAIYIYGGQRLTHGSPPYVSMMDPKGPISSFLCGAGVAVARLFGRDDLLVIRAEFCALAVVGVLGIFLLVLELTRSIIAGVVGAVVFMAFRTFAFYAWVGPEGHMPAIVFMIFALWLTVRRNWYLAGVAASLAFLTWQPMFAYPVIALVCALVWSPGRRIRAGAWNVAGGATPFLVLVVYYAIDGHLKQFFDGLFVYPLTGVVRPPDTVGRRLAFFWRDISNIYQLAAILYWVGLALVVAAAVLTVVRNRDGWRSALLRPMVLLFAVTLLFNLAYVMYDYIGYPHSWPMLPYVSVGFGVAIGALVARIPAERVRWATASLTAAAAALAVVCAVDYSSQPPPTYDLHAQEAASCAIKRSLVPGTPLWSTDLPNPLVLLHRRQPDDFPYVGGGLDVWKVDHTKGGFEGWMNQITESRASIVIVDGWVSGKYKHPMFEWLFEHGYKRGYIGPWRVFVTKDARERMTALSLELSPEPGTYPLTTHGGEFTRTHCTKRMAG